MKRINILDEHTSNKIAAGEVVERPSSVAKELIENSIDAGAKNITIEIEEGGTALIKIIDDGHGIHKDDINKAFLPHATSKISNVEDIYAINTLGFRGEALPSIASVSKVILRSKPTDQENGIETIIEAGSFIETKEVGMNSGTIMEVRDIFFNVPARKKFLKSISREASIISNIITRIALSNPEISIKFYNNVKKMLHTYGTGNLKDVIRTVYGKTISENTIYFESVEDSITVYGYIGKEEIARGSRNNQSIFVNGRYINNRTLVVAVENAFKSFATVNKFPFFILFVEVYPEFVDVNIHPTKAEVKFRDEKAIFKKVFDAVHKSFKDEIFQSFTIPEEEQLQSEYKPIDKVEEIQFVMEEEKEDEKYKSPSDLTIEREEILKEEEKYKTLMNLRKEGKLNFTPPKENENKTVDIPVDLKTTSDYSKNIILEDLKRESSVNTEIIQNKNKIETEPEIMMEAKFPDLKVIGQFNKTYILAEYDEVLYMIDQHAAHEKILFEKYMINIEKQDIVVQSLLVPVLIDLSMDDFSYFDENKDIFKATGFVIEEFGGNTLAIKEVPYILGKLDAKELFLNILDNLKSLGSGKTTEIKYNKIASMACRAAVKANDSLSIIEMEKLINTLRYIEDPFHCPHGRPIIIKFTNYELEKKFRRIV